MLFTSAATSLRMSLAIFVPSKILAGIRAPRFGFRLGYKILHRLAPSAADVKLETRGNLNPSRPYAAVCIHFEYNALVMIAKDLLDILVCPACKLPLEYRENPESLKCRQCRRVYLVKDDIPIMLLDEATIEN
jgi:uncharacterized protein YbaR (Trm112 family)